MPVSSEDNITKMNSAEPEIFLVENDKALRDLISLGLSRLGYKVTPIKQPGELFSLAKQALPQLILIDLFIPGWDALDFIRRIKKDEILGTVPLMVLSSYGFEEVIIQTASLGVVDFVLKPFDIDFLLAKIKKWMNPKP